jgi:hypothetical protein
MVAMHVSDEDLHSLVEACFGYDHLSLSVLATVEHEMLVFPLHDYGGKASFRRWDTGACA